MTTTDEFRTTSPAFEPEPLARPIDNAAIGRAAEERRRRARGAGAPPVILGLLGVLAAIAYWIPELGLTILMPDVFAQFAPIVSREVFTGGAELVPDVVDAGLAPTIALGAAFALGFAARQGGFWRHLVAPAGFVTALAVVPIVIATAVDPVRYAFALAAALACIAFGAVAAVQAIRGYRRRGPHPFARRVPSLDRWRTNRLVAYLLVLPWPFVVGRALVGGDWRDRSAEIAASGSSAFISPLFSWALPLAWLLGASIGVVVWAALRFVPPSAETLPAPARLGPHGHVLPAIEAGSGSSGGATSSAAAARAAEAAATGTVTRRPSRVAPAVVAAVLAVAGVGIVAPTASGEAAATVEITRTQVPFQSDASCPVFTRPSDPAASLLPGRGCAGLESYFGYERTGFVETPTLDAAAGHPMAGGETITGDVAAAVYEPLLVIAGSTNGADLDVVLAYSFDDASLAWSFQCPDAGPLAVRFSGTGADDPASARVTHEGEGAGVFVGCLDGGTRLLDPWTGVAY